MRSLLVVGVCLVILSVFASGSSSGEPFLASDPYPKGVSQPTRFIVVAGESWYSIPAQKLPDGGTCLKFDLAPLPDGEHTVTIRAINDRSHVESTSVLVKLVKIREKVTILASPEEREPSGPPIKQEKVLKPPSKIPKGMLRPPGQ